MLKNSIFKNHIARYLREDQDRNFTINIPSHKGVHFAKTIREHILNNKKIFIWGDYDVDGIFSTIFMTEIIKDVAKFNNRTPKLESRVPSRAEHYGIKYNNFQALVNSYDLIITVDNGTHKDFYSKLSRDDKKKLLVLDHHPNGNFEDEPNIINPNTDGKVSISTGMLIDFIHESMRYIDQSYHRRRDENFFKDLATITLISDMANVNNKIIRSYIKRGLEVISKRERPAYSHFFPEWKNNVTLEDVAFNLIPKINSVGRLGLELDWVVELFTAKKETQFVKESLLKLEDTNEQRKEILNHYTKEMEREIQKQGFDLYNAPLLYLHNDDTPIGINGLIAGNLSQKYGTNVVFTSINYGGDEKAIGSGRGDNIRNELLSLFDKHPELKNSTHFGGHLKAIGLRTSSHDALLESIKEYSKNTPKSYVDTTKQLISETSVSLRDYFSFCKEYNEICNTIPLNSSFYTRVSLLVLGFDQYRNNFVKLVCQDQEGELIEIVTKQNSDVDLLSEEYIDMALEIKSIDINNVNVVFTDIKNINSFQLNNRSNITQEEEQEENLLKP